MPGSPRLIVSSPSASLPEGGFGEGESNEVCTPSAPVSVLRVRESFRKPGRISLVLSNGVELVLSLTVAVEFSAHRPGSPLSTDALSALTTESQVTAVIDRALGFMARARRTRAELKVRLSKLDFDPVLVRVALDRLEDRGLLSDAAVAEAEAGSRVRAGESPLRIRQRLRAKGISDEYARIAVQKAIVDEDYDEEAECLRVAQKRSRSLVSADPSVARRRLTAYLARRGYSLTFVRDIVHRLIPE